MKEKKRSIMTIIALTIVLVILSYSLTATISRLQAESVAKETKHIELKEEIALLRTDLLREFDIIRRHSFHFVMNTLIRKCIEKDIPVNIALSLIQMESNFDPNAISWTGDHGLFQFNLRIWKNALEIDESKLYDPEYNIEIGLTILKKCYEQGGNWGLAVGIYNRGRNHMESKHPEKLAKSMFGKGMIK